MAGSNWLSTVELIYAPVQFAVEASVAVDVLKGPRNFKGIVTSWTARNRKSKIILFDSEAPGTVNEVTDAGSVMLSRRVVAVPLDEKLVLHICSGGDGGGGVKLNLGQQDGKRIISIGSYKLQVNVTWTSNLSSRRKRVFKNFERTMLLM